MREAVWLVIEGTRTVCRAQIVHAMIKQCGRYRAIASLPVLARGHAFAGPNSFGRRRVRINSHLRNSPQPAAQSRAKHVFRQPTEHKRDTDPLQRRQAFA